MVPADVPNHDGSPRDSKVRVFDVPDEIGPLISASGWVEKSSMADRGMATLMATLLVMCGYAALRSKVLTFDAGAFDVVVFVVVVFCVFWFFGPDAHCTCVGKHGVSVSRRRYGVIKKRELFLFADADDVETRVTRIVTDAHSNLYTRTEVVYIWWDKEAYEVFALEGSIVEPVQRASVNYLPEEPFDGSLIPRYGSEHPVVLAQVAIAAFHASKDQREATPYR